MFVGHYAAAFAARAIEPRAPLWAYVGAAQLLDIGWSALVLAGVEKLSIDPTLPGSALVLYDMPFTHSLPGALVISAAAAGVARALRLPWRAAAMVGLVVFSHWLLDLLVHRPDLLLWPGGGKVGLAWWNHAVPEATLEMALLALAGSAWAAQRARAGFALWPGLLFLAFLAALQLVGELMTPGAPRGMATTALAAYLVATGLAALLDRRRGAFR